jgi:hypothetical protein
MDFSITSGQVPLLYRLHFLLRDLISGDLAPQSEVVRKLREEQGTEATHEEGTSPEEGTATTSLGKTRFLFPTSYLVHTYSRIGQAVFVCW